MILDRLYSSVVCVGLGDLEKKEERGRLLIVNVSVSKWYHGPNI